MTDVMGLALDPETNDLMLTADGNLALSEGARAIGEHARQRLMFYRGEWFLDTGAGTPWFQYVFVRPFNEVVSEAVVKKAVLDTPGVTRILAIDTAIDRLQRGYQVREMEVETVLDQPVTVNSITIGGA